MAERRHLRSRGTGTVVPLRRTGTTGGAGRDRVLASGSRNGPRQAGRIRAAIALRLAADSAAKGLQGGSCGQYNQQRRVDTPLHTQEVTGSSPVAPTIRINSLDVRNVRPPA